MLEFLKGSRGYTDMQLAAPNQALGTLAHNQRAALVSLLVDEDPAIYQIVRTKLLDFGPRVCEWLRPHLLSNDPVMRRRAREIVQLFERQASNSRMLQFCYRQGEELDLETATGLLAQTQFPEVNPQAYTALYDSWAQDIWEQIQGLTQGETILGAINTYLFGELGFSGNVHYIYEPECSYLNRVVDMRSGNPISLCALYLFLARRLRLPITGIALANHFLCRYQSTTKEIYIDAFRRGRFWTKADCVKHLLRVNQGFQSGGLTPATPKHMLMRMCANLHRTYAHLEQPDEAARVQHYNAALAR